LYKSTLKRKISKKFVSKRVYEPIIKMILGRGIAFDCTNINSILEGMIWMCEFNIDNLKFCETNTGFESKKLIQPMLIAYVRECILNHF
jgi:hypothetical protein